ncbi:MAG: cyclic nucleotide-binding domain-containing protein [Elusimicrobia bacterium]|nr:cyclic nucleotide-binding domain-containing protein [Elusimicrobiota bacterium]
MDALTFLRAHVPLFAGLSDVALTPLAESATLKTCAAGQSVMFAGMTVDFLHVVATGTVFVQAKVAGKGMVRLADLGTGEVFGEASMLEASVAGATVKAGEGGAVVLLIPEAAFRRLAAENAEFAERVRALIARRRAPPSKPVSA